MGTMDNWFRLPYYWLHWAVNDGLADHWGAILDVVIIGTYICRTLLSLSGICDTSGELSGRWVKRLWQLLPHKEQFKIIVHILSHHTQALSPSLSLSLSVSVSFAVCVCVRMRVYPCVCVYYCEYVEACVRVYIYIFSCWWIVQTLYLLFMILCASPFSHTPKISWFDHLTLEISILF